VSWHPFQLNPELPADGVDRKRYLEDKFGGPERAAEIYARVREAGASVGIPFAFERVLRQPNTLDAHRLISWAQRQRAADGLVEALFRAYFIDGRYLGDRAELAAIAADAGFDAAAALRDPVERGCEPALADVAPGTDDVRDNVDGERAARPGFRHHASATENRPPLCASTRQARGSRAIMRVSAKPPSDAASRALGRLLPGHRQLR
jgi:hypothetical protein